MIEIIKLIEIKEVNRDIVQNEIEEIFFLSSSIKSFDTMEKKRAFFNRWCGVYQSLYPQEFFLAMKGGKILGYLSGCSDSLGATKHIEVSSYSLFSDLFYDFPAHLHINFHPDSRGQGLGSLLVNHYKSDLKSNKVKGVHLITSPDAQNVNFYKRLGFSTTYERSYSEMPLFFMGCSLLTD